MSETSKELSKTVELLANDNHSNQKKCYKQFLYRCLQCNCSHKKDLVT